MADTLQIPPGHVCVTTYGPIRHETAVSMWDMRAHSERNGLTNVLWTTLPSTLVEKARNEACRGLLRDPNAGWLMFVDGDMTASPDALLRMVSTAYGEAPWVDVLGGYCNLRGEAAIPTIDSGTGTWESHYPGSGLIEVMRTGAAFLLVKRHVLEGLKDPWFRMRVPARPIDFLAEVDNFCRIKFDGKNPFRNLPNGEWEKLEQCAVEDPSSGGDFVPAEVGEDSGFADRCRMAGYRIAVHTDIVTGHVDTKVIGWGEHRKAMDEQHRQWRLAVGLQ